MTTTKRLEGNENKPSDKNAVVMIGRDKTLASLERTDGRDSLLPFIVKRTERFLRKPVGDFNI
ncbi:MAG: hypothetical protein ABR981_05195 [Candidatus Micrarchaeaceae archaeon]|jgi:hypothetical protein